MFSRMAGFLIAVAVLIYAGAFIAGIVIGGVYMFSVWAGGFVSGSFFLGMAEIVRLLRLSVCHYEEVERRWMEEEHKRQTTKVQ